MSKSLNRGIALALGLKAPRQQNQQKKTYVEQSWLAAGNAISQSKDQNFPTDR